MTFDDKIIPLHGIRDDRKAIYRYVPTVPRPGIPALRIINGPGVGWSSQLHPQPVQPEVP